MLSRRRELRERAPAQSGDGASDRELVLAYSRRVSCNE
jgi:hypothetical protein